MIKYPLIGLTSDSQDPSPNENGEFHAGYFSIMPYYAIRQNYCDAVTSAGGAAFILPYQEHLVDFYANLLDGLVLTGGGFDIDPALYGATSIHPSVKVKKDRTTFEWAIAKRMMELKKPILGICGGMQLLNVMHGGTLIQDIPSEKADAINHQQKPPFNKGGHDVSIQSGTLLEALADGCGHLQVNTGHHQAIDLVSDDFIVSAFAPDGIVEAIEWKDSSYFCIGVQWHPEYHVSLLDQHIFKRFIQAAKA